MVAMLRRLLQMIFDILSKGQVESVCADLQDNLLPYPYFETTHTQTGITWTDNGDGTFTANGTATANSFFTIYHRSNEFKIDEPCIITGCPDGGSEKGYCMITAYKDKDNNSLGGGFEYGDGILVKPYKGEYQGFELTARIYAGTTVSNLTFKPMMIKGSVAPKNYKAYSSGNAGLQKQINVLANVDSSLQKQIDNLVNKDTNLQSQINSLNTTSAGLQSQINNLVSAVEITFNADNTLKEDIFPPEGFTTSNCFVAGYIHTTASGGNYCNCINTDSNVQVVPKILAYADKWSLFKTGIVGGTGSFSATGTLTLFLVRC